jgi:hypothetical protein
MHRKPESEVVNTNPLKKTKPDGKDGPLVNVSLQSIQKTFLVYGPHGEQKVKTGSTWRWDECTSFVELVISLHLLD